jgi:hypothetical protein
MTVFMCSDRGRRRRVDPRTERRPRVTSRCLKFLTVRIDEEQKRLDKIKKIATPARRRRQPRRLRLRVGRF